MRLNNQFLMLYQKLANVEQKYVNQKKLCELNEMENNLLRYKVEKMEKNMECKSEKN